MVSLKPIECAHWHYFFEGISASSLDFYKSLEESITTSKVPDTAISRVDKLEGGPLSAKRTYLELRRDWFTYHICAAPFGTGFFVSSRLLMSPWKSWPIIAGIGGAGLLFLFILFLIVSGMFGIVMGFLTVTFLSFPMLMLFGIIVLAWILNCLRLTYYRQDTMLAFYEAVHRLLIAKINETMEAKGRKPLTETESKPILHKLLRGGGT